METAVLADMAEGEKAARLDSLIQELGLLRKTVLRQGHAQELFQARVEEAVARLAASPERARPQTPPGLGSAQVRVLLELDQSVLQLLRLAEGSETEETPE